MVSREEIEARLVAGECFSFSWLMANVARVGSKTIGQWNDAFPGQIEMTSDVQVAKVTCSEVHTLRPKEGRYMGEEWQ